MGIEPMLPEFIQAPAIVGGAQGEDVFGSGLRPDHARLFAAPANDRFASSFPDPRRLCEDLNGMRPVTLDKFHFPIRYQVQ